MKAITTKSLLLSVLVTGCVAGDNATEEPAPAPEEPALPEQVDLELAASCADIVAAQPTSQDGLYTLYVEGDVTRPWTAYCDGMAASPAEYLPLVKIGAGFNFSQYTAGGFAAGTTVRTSYTRLRINPDTLQIDIHDKKFAASSGALAHGGDQVTSMPFGVAMNCGGSPGLANIDLSGTPFIVADTFKITGNAATGTSNVAEQIVSLEGRGSCGWNAVEGAPFNPYNGGVAMFALQLSYK